MVKSIIIVFLICAGVFAQTTNKIVYEGNLDSLVRINPFAYQINEMTRDSISISGGDTSHYSLISWVINLQDSLDDKLNRSEYSPTGFDSTFVYQFIDDSTMHSIDYPDPQVIRFLNRNADSLGAIWLAPELEIGEGFVLGLTYSIQDSDYVLTSETTSWDKNASDDITTTILNDSNYVLTSETSSWDKNSSDDVTVTILNDSNYVLTSETSSWDKSTADDVTTTMLNDSNYVLTSETSAWDKDASNDILTTTFDDSVAHYISDAAYAAGWDGVTTIAPSKNAVYDLTDMLINMINTVGAFSVSEFIVNDEDVEIDLPANIFINMAGSTGNRRVIFSVPTISATVCVRVINVPSGESCTLNFGDLLNGTDVNIVLTDADNGSTFIFTYSPTLTYWYQIL